MQGESQCRDWLDLLAGISEARDLLAIARLADAGRRLCAGWAESDQGSLGLSLSLSEMNDRVTRRLIELISVEHRLPSVPWCWLALGSEGRHEQTFCTDQDNGLIFSAVDQQEAEALRQLFLPFAQAVNAGLAHCGLALCSGGVMAGNPHWCLSLEEWQWQFSEWVRRPEPLALLHATIFFDFRSLYGDPELGSKLRSHLLGLTQDTPAFLHLMAANALQVLPPLGFLGDVCRAAGEAGGAVDLKKFGTRLFVDVARIFSLAHGVERVDTIGRLAVAGEAAGMQPAELAAAIGALSQLQRLRLGRQARVFAMGGIPDHRLDPSQLHELDQVILRGALKQARRLQQRLKLNYAL